MSRDIPDVRDGRCPTVPAGVGAHVCTSTPTSTQGWGVSEVEEVGLTRRVPRTEGAPGLRQGGVGRVVSSGLSPVRWVTPARDTPTAHWTGGDPGVGPRPVRPPVRAGVAGARGTSPTTTTTTGSLCLTRTRDSTSFVSHTTSVSSVRRLSSPRSSRDLHGSPCHRDPLGTPPPVPMRREG